MASASSTDSLGAAAQTPSLDDLSAARVFGEPLPDLGDAGIALVRRQRQPLVLDREERQQVPHVSSSGASSAGLHATDARRPPESTK
jgi:hypothetical protein